MTDSAFTRRLADRALAIEATLDRLLPDIDGSRLRSSMRYALLGGGKRLRPYLVMESAALFDVDPARAARVGAALECIHCYSLAHDDLPAMDNDDLRRGKPTLHRAYDEATAILAGDALQALAFEILSGIATHDSGSVRAILVQELARAAGEAGMAGGQMRDIHAPEALSTPPEIAAMQEQKTGALIRFACEAGAILAGGDRKALAEFGKLAGLAFQIADDVLDVEASSIEAGKTTGKDQNRGKATLVRLLGPEKAKQEAARLSLEAIAALSGFGDKAEPLRAAAQFIVSRRS